MGVIGGPDGPTAIFVSGDPTSLPAALAVLAVLAAAGIALWLGRRDNK
ncbi:MAG: sodium ion-translocating decarboxylase subunit beta [Oscillospiraceae bacterium]|mgnify:CR=1 FL=1|nr:sodium ion-translocating decarboxylase subunit beta [Oscillospiraceae bacterium]